MVPHAVAFKVWKTFLTTSCILVPETAPFTISPTVVNPSVPASPDDPKKSDGILDRVRSIVLGLVATGIGGIMTNSFAAANAPLLPARKDDGPRPGLNLPRPNFKNPFERERFKADSSSKDKVFFDGNVLNISLPVKPEDHDELDSEGLESDIGDVVSSVLLDVFKPESDQAESEGVPQLKVVVSESEDKKKLIINAQAEESELGDDVQGGRPVVTRPQRPLIPGRPVLRPGPPSFPNRRPSSNENQRPLVPDNNSGRPPFVTIPQGGRPTNQNRPNFGNVPQGSQQRPAFGNVPQGDPNRPVFGTGDQQRPGGFGNQARPEFGSNGNVNRPLTPNTGGFNPGFTGQPGSGTRDNVIKFQPEDAITQPTRGPSRTTQNPFFPPTGDSNEISNAISEEEDRVFDSRLNSILNSGGSSANIVEATVVEDFDYARRVRDSRGRRGRIGVATIVSIAAGVLALLVFALLVFLALARRRRRAYSTTPSTTVATPSQSRTTITGTPPVTADMASVSDLRTTSYLDDLPSSGPLSLDLPPPTMPIDGHQTIVSSYEDYLAGGAASNLPSTATSPMPSEVPKTQDLGDNDDYLFAPSAEV